MNFAYFILLFKYVATKKILITCVARTVFRLDSAGVTPEQACPVSKQIFFWFCTL